MKLQQKPHPLIAPSIFFSAKKIIFSIVLWSAIHFSGFGQNPSNNASAPSEFPAGKIEGPFVWESNIYPGTVRDYWVYVPAQYEAAKPACVMVVQDGLGRAQGWRLPQVLDSLIATQDLPVIIGIFVDHGKVAADAPDKYPRYNRSFEYDALGDRYARFLIEELLPEVGRSYNLSDDPNDRSIAGASSGAICAFNVAWEKPDAFRRVLSTIGTYVGLRGGDEFATLVRKTEPKPLRVFLEDGSSDLNIYAGDWWMANQDMLSALTWAGYEVNHMWGEEGHNSEGAKKILPDALKWLWQDYPKPVTTHPEDYKGLQLLLPEEPWKSFSQPDIKAHRLAVDENGKIFFTDLNAPGIFTFDNDGQAVLFKKLTFHPGGLSFHHDGNLYVADLDGHQIVALDRKGDIHTVLTGVQADHLSISQQGIYFTNPWEGQIGFYNFSSQQLSYVQVTEKPAGMALSADQTFLNVAVEEGVLGYSFKISKEGRLAYGQPYIHYHVSYGKPTPAATGITVDTENRSYTATAMGVQVADQLGRINFIFSKPGEALSGIKIGGQAFDTLYLICNGQLYFRKINARGALSWQPAVKPPQPRM